MVDKLDEVSAQCPNNLPCFKIYSWTTVSVIILMWQKGSVGSVTGLLTLVAFPHPVDLRKVALSAVKI